MTLKTLKRILLASASVAVISALVVAMNRNDAKAIKQAQETGKLVQVVATASATSNIGHILNTTTGARYDWPAVPRKPVASKRDDPESGSS
jgi:hypothetical protein